MHVLLPRPIRIVLPRWRPRTLAAEQPVPPAEVVDDPPGPVLYDLLEF